ncbi:hypothetical protein NCAS_0A14750 [Naumovozyma castellii]|uniref:Sulfhydryl oxidase n=1 Tax=Naumovozyma castellii TaxID=27288 RepID=G0V983_NAUCA|nr:hypothetical protein NCAS_0A14750 [Naumovozyma castellii CBS 4309]CCC68033.1 hypothetical protein NCAS_0A14750 [Naumovozyma castellii CBS 4309]
MNGNRFSRILLRLCCISVVIGLWVYLSNFEYSVSSDSLSHIKEVVEEAEVEEEAAVIEEEDYAYKRGLGRASWKHFHTMLARFPDEPRDEDRDKLIQLIELFGELYPYVDYKLKYQEKIRSIPMQTSSRTAVSLWGCHIHNSINEDIGKSLYDCSIILQEYDCGFEIDKHVALTGDDDDREDYKNSLEMDQEGENKNGDDLRINKVTIEKEDKQLG